MSDSISAEANSVLNHMYSLNPCYYRTTVTRRVAKELLLYMDGTVLISGQMYRIKANSLGAGVYELTLERF